MLFLQTLYPALRRVKQPGSLVEESANSPDLTLALLDRNEMRLIGGDMGMSWKTFRSGVKPRLAVLLLLLSDIAILLACIIASLLLRFDGQQAQLVLQRHLEPHLASLPIALAVYVCVLSLFRLYRCAWRFAGTEMLWTIVVANTTGAIILTTLQVFVDGSAFPRSVLIMIWGSGIVGIGGVRLVLREFCRIAESRKHSEPRETRKNGTSKRVVILGAGENGVRILRAIRTDPTLHYNVIGFLDDDPGKQGVYVNNTRVLGPLDVIRDLVDGRAVDEAVIAVPHISPRRLRQYVMECRRRKVPVKVVPHLRDVLNGRTSVQFVDVSVEDLLGRAPIDPDTGQIGNCACGKRVMVTGAGGSIGYELCRQIVEQDPHTLILLGHGENSLHRVCTELRRDYPHMVGRMHCVVASIAHQHRMAQVFERYNPQVVFHTAAHKHVPMMETNEQEAAHNNVLGTYWVADACGRSGVERMVLISTDKATDPCSVMGATKRWCEEIVRSSAAMWPETCFITVRFGNVLGSRGSVVPLFHEQIRRGGPVTVTHPDMTRYFMTVHEAATLVLRAGAAGKSGEVYLLDMGKPVKIVDLARDMIRLCGYEPGVDIELEFTGMRPGERLHESLTAPEERIENTPWKGLALVRRPEPMEARQVDEMVGRLDRASNFGTPEEVRKILNELCDRVCRPQRVASKAPRKEISAGVRTEPAG